MTDLENNHGFTEWQVDFDAMVARDEILGKMAEAFLSNLANDLKDGGIDGKSTFSRTLDLVVIETCIAQDKALLAQLEAKTHDDGNKKLLEEVYKWNQ